MTSDACLLMRLRINVPVLQNMLKIYTVVRNCLPVWQKDLDFNISIMSFVIGCVSL